MPTYSQFMEDINALQNAHEEERRRSLEVNTGFYDKLAAISAGSIAVVASIVLAVLFKTEPRPVWVRTALHELLIVVLFLWLSLVLAILHNFLVAFLATTQANLSENQFIHTVLERTITDEAPQADGFNTANLEAFLRERSTPKQIKLFTRSRRINKVVSTVGYGSIAVFLIAFSLVPVFLFRLW